MRRRIARLAATLSLASLFALTLAIALSAGLPQPARAASPIYVRTNGHDTQCNGTVNVAYSLLVSPNCAVATIQRGVNIVDRSGSGQRKCWRRLLRLRWQHPQHGHAGA